MCAVIELHMTGYAGLADPVVADSDLLVASSVLNILL